MDKTVLILDGYNQEGFHDGRDGTDGGSGK